MKPKRLRVGLVFGGRSGEHEVSLRSARSILDALDRERYEPVLLGIDHDGRWHLQGAASEVLSPPGTPLTLDTGAPDLAVAPGSAPSTDTLVTTHRSPIVTAGVSGIDVFFPVVHGTYGEDGTLQGLLEMAGVPYVGSGVLGSSVGMDKDVSKKLLRDAGLPVVDWFTVHARDFALDRVHSELSRRGFGWPVFVKPANLGSSVGVSRVTALESLHTAITEALRYDRKVLIERGHAVRELECGVLGNDVPVASVVGEIVPSHAFYSYEAKYLDDHGAVLCIPADIPGRLSDTLREMAVQAFACLELSGLARVDFFVEKSTGAVYVNEVNTLPGFTRISMYPKLWEATGVPYPALVDKLIALALERHALRTKLSTRYLPDGE